MSLFLWHIYSNSCLRKLQVRYIVWVLARQKLLAATNTSLSYWWSIFSGAHGYLLRMKTALHSILSSYMGTLWLNSREWTWRNNTMWYLQGPFMKESCNAPSFIHRMGSILDCEKWLKPRDGRARCPRGPKSLRVSQNQASMAVLDCITLCFHMRNNFYSKE